MMKKLILALITLPLFAQTQRPPLADPVLTKDNVVVMNEQFSAESCAKVVKEARDLDFRTLSTDPIYLIINSPGGSIQAGLELIENLSSLRRKVSTINLFSASMGFQTAQGLNERLITKTGTLMSHKASGTFSGEFPGQFDSRYQYILKKILRLDEHTVSRTKGKHTLESYRTLTENEYWCDGADCVEQGFADRVVAPSCDKSLSGTNTKLLASLVILGTPIEVKAVFDACPINTSPLSVDISANGKSIFDVTNKIPPELLFEIQKQANEVIKKDQEKEVIRSY
jgi:ATP-dependent protease ClpP protease subunit